MGSTWSPVAGYVATTRCGRRSHDLLATGASYAMVLRALDDANTTLEQRHRVTIDSIRNHANRHFPVQQVARATYRDILERRAKENSIDFIEGVAPLSTRPRRQGPAHARSLHVGRHRCTSANTTAAADG